MRPTAVLQPRVLPERPRGEGVGVDAVEMLAHRGGRTFRLPGTVSHPSSIPKALEQM